MVDIGEGVLFKPKASIFDLAGSRAAYATIQEMKARLDKLKEEGV